MLFGAPPASQIMNPSEYLLQLLKDKQQLTAFPSSFVHIGRLLDAEISRVRSNVFYLGLNTEPLQLPEPLGPPVNLIEKLVVPVKDHPDFNFVGRLLGPRGLTIKQLELDTGCRILIRGQGSMRDKHKEEQMKGKAKWEHLNEDLHVLVTVEDAKNRASIRLKKAVEEVRKLLMPIPESEDELKKRQLTELAVLNGTYKGFNGGILLTKSRDFGQGVLLSPPPAQLLLSPTSPSPIFLASGPIFHGPVAPIQSQAPLTPLPSPGMGPQQIVYPSQAPQDFNIMYQIESCLPSNPTTPSGTYEFNPFIQSPMINGGTNGLAFAH